MYTNVCTMLFPTCPTHSYNLRIQLVADRYWLKLLDSRLRYRFDATVSEEKKRKRLHIKYTLVVLFS